MNLRSLLISLYLLPLTLLAQTDDPAPKPPKEDILAEPHELWMGKWDDENDAFLRVYPPALGSKDGSFRVKYMYRTAPGGAQHVRWLKGRSAPAGYTRANFIYFRLPMGDDPKLGIAYDDSGKRMAYMVKIEPNREDSEKVNVEEYGWKPGAIPPEEARRIVLGPDADLLGPPNTQIGKNVTAADEVLKGARLLQDAKDLWVRRGNDPAKVTWENLKPLLHPENPFTMRDGKDLYGRAYSLGDAKEGVKVHPDTYEILKEAFPDVWGDFAPGT